VDTLVRYLNYDVLMPSFQNLITQACLRVRRPAGASSAAGADVSCARRASSR
jgi:hypothetical protein